jgi:hypothetical protein
MEAPPQVTQVQGAAGHHGVRESQMEEPGMERPIHRQVKRRAAYDRHHCRGRPETTQQPHILGIVATGPSNPRPLQPLPVYKLQRQRRSMHPRLSCDGRRLTGICRSVYIDQQNTASALLLFLKAGSTVADAHSDSTDTSINDADRHMHAFVVQPLGERVAVSSRLLPHGLLARPRTLHGHGHGASGNLSLR